MSSIGSSFSFNETTLLMSGRNKCTLVLFAHRRQILQTFASGSTLHFENVFGSICSQCNFIFSKNCLFPIICRCVLVSQWCVFCLFSFNVWPNGASLSIFRFLLGSRYETLMSDPAYINHLLVDNIVIGSFFYADLFKQVRRNIIVLA